MDKITITEGDLNARDMRIVIVAARFNEFIVESLLKGSISLSATPWRDRPLQLKSFVCLERTKCHWQWRRLPQRAVQMASSRWVRSFEVRHHILTTFPGECMRGVAAVGREHGIPIGMGVLTTDSIEQAIERAGTKAGNKGEEATLAVIEMISLIRKLD